MKTRDLKSIITSSFESEAMNRKQHKKPLWNCVRDFFRNVTTLIRWETCPHNGEFYEDALGAQVCKKCGWGHFPDPTEEELREIELEEYYATHWTCKVCGVEHWDGGTSCICYPDEEIIKEAKDPVPNSLMAALELYSRGLQINEGGDSEQEIIDAALDEINRRKGGDSR